MFHVKHERCELFNFTRQLVQNSTHVSRETRQMFRESQQGAGFAGFHVKHFDVA